MVSPELFVVVDAENSWKFKIILLNFLPFWRFVLVHSFIHLFDVEQSFKTALYILN